MSFGGFVGVALVAGHGIRRLAPGGAEAACPEPAKAPHRGMAEHAAGVRLIDRARAVLL
jgi:hypothetical protein